MIVFDGIIYFFGIDKFIGLCAKKITSNSTTFQKCKIQETQNERNFV